MSDETTVPDPDETPVTPEVPEAADAPPAIPPAPPIPPADEAAPVPPAPAVPISPDVPSHRRGMRIGGVLFGLVLVLVGVLALTGGVNSVFDVLRLWPLLIVLGGVMRMFSWYDHETPIKRAAEGLGSVAFGLVLLGNTMGYIPWNVWFAIFSLWPLLLVAIGIELVGKGLHQDGIRALSNVVLILGLAYAVLVVQPSGGAMNFQVLPVSGLSAPFSNGFPHDAAVTVGTAEIKVGATKLSISAGDSLVSVAGKAAASDPPVAQSSTNGSDAIVTVGDSGDRNVFLGTAQRTLDVTLDRSVAWREIRLDVGAVTADADFSGLEVAAVKMNVGASDAKIKIGSRAKVVKLDISGGATSVTVLVPADAACTVNSTSGLSNIRVPSSFKRVNGIVLIGNSTFVAAGSGGPKIAITLASGVSDLRIETY